MVRPTIIEPLMNYEERTWHGKFRNHMSNIKRGPNLNYQFVQLSDTDSQRLDRAKKNLGNIRYEYMFKWE